MMLFVKRASNQAAVAQVNRQADEVITVKRWLWRAVTLRSNGGCTGIVVMCFPWRMTTIYPYMLASFGAGSMPSQQMFNCR